MATRRLTIRSGDEGRTVDIEEGSQAAAGATVRIDGDAEPLQVEPLQPGAYRVTQGERSWSVFAAGSRDTCWAFVDGHVYELEVSSERAARRRRAAGAHEALSAPMPATVVKILAEPGQQVKKGDTLMLLEAMKMELPVRAPGDGTIAAIKCREGELVQPGSALLEFE